ncbi:MAG TPA: Ig-like domain-containing protein [Candidatus Angelobacter sp.]|nr:Ig-like domain-containing protein [Candidatus Angelobacter sp.]
MPTTLTEKYSFVRRNIILLAILVLVPVLGVAQTHPLFNLSSSSTSPFPSDRFTAFDNQQLTGLRVNLALPNCATHPSDCADLTLLNQLDGFNLQPRIAIPFDGAIDPSTVNSSTVFLVQIPAGFSGDGDQPVTPNIIGINQTVWDPASLTLFVESDQHLTQRSSYLLVVTNGVLDASGNPIAASKSFLNLEADGSADARLRAYRQALRALIDNGTLNRIAPGLDKKNIAAASLFTTESATATLESIRAQIKAAAPPTVDFNLGTGGEKTVFPVNTITGFTWNVQALTVGPLIPTSLNGDLAALQVFPGSVGKLAFGKFSGQHWQNGNVFIPQVPTTQSVPSQGSEEIFFNLFLPSGPRPTNGWPVAIFGHGFTDSKQGAPFAVASTLAHNGIATIAINVVGHGFGPNSTLTIKQGTTATTFLEGGRGFDQDGNGQITSAEGSSTFFASPQGIIGSRDALQQTTADLMQLVRAIEGGIDADGDGLPDLDANRIYYAGQSFGGIYGTIFLGIEPDVKAGVPNVPGGPIIDIVRLSPSFQLLLTQSLAVRVPSLLNAGPPIFFNDNSPLRDLPPVTNTVPGAIAIQTVEDTSRWLGQAGDPVAWAPFINESPLAGDLSKPVIIQFARGDKTVPNPTATALIRSGNLKDRATFFRNDLAFALGVGFGKNPHTFLTNIGGTPPVAAVAVGAQSQIAIFFTTNGALTIDPDGPGPLFEVPIAGALPEDLGFIP